MSPSPFVRTLPAALRPRRRSAGFSLLELLTVIAILGIVSVMAFSGMQYLSHSTNVKAASTTIYAALLRARSEAVKRNGTVTLTAASGGDWQTGWTLTDASGSVISNQGPLKGVVIRSNVTTNLIYLSSGRIQGTITPWFSVTHGSTGNDPTQHVGRCITASPNGTPYVKPTTCSF